MQKQIVAAIQEAAENFENIKRLLSIIQTRDPADLDLEWERDLEERQEKARRELLNLALSIEVREAWHEVGDEDVLSDEYKLTLSCGGPALQVVGELSGGTPTSAIMQWQDSENPWTDYAEADEETLLAFAQQFYFGD